jgi:Lrp/AsnC family transcriptional regulator, regulator for asnA, asnC and gidA
MRASDARSFTTIDAIDRAIIGELQDDGRKSIVALAELIGLSEGAIRRRIDHLQAIGVLRIAGLPDPTAFGLQRHFIGISVNEESLDIVRGALVAMPEMSYVWETDGQYNLMTAAFFNGNDQLRAFLSGRLSKIPGVRQVEVFRMRRTVKKTRRWPAPQPMSLDADAEALEPARRSM